MNHLLKTTLFCTLALLLGGCSSRSLLHNSVAGQHSGTDYRLIFYIHGDGDYLYHSPDGQPIQADEHALNKAFEAARDASTGDVTIFHRREKRSFLGLFPRNTSRMYQFTGGEKVREISYRGNDSASGFMDEESRLFNDVTDSIPGEKSPVIFLYFGHEIPQQPETRYHRSYSDREFSTEIFTEEIRTFLPPGKSRFNLIALSTCSNGTPEMASKLKPIAHTLLASPQNLHLSHLDVGALRLLEDSTGSDSASVSIADSIAQDSFRRLSEEVRTAVTLSVYQLDKLSTDLETLLDSTENYRSENRLNHGRDNIDCADQLNLSGLAIHRGVKSFYQPAQFGAHQSKNTHSGWGCKPTLSK
jgi:hypothetical protein